MNKKKSAIVLMIMLSIILLTGTSYALLRSSQKGENTYVMNVGVLEVSFVDSKTNAFTFDNMIPLPDTEGMEIEKELTFTVKNTGAFPAEYDVYIEETSTNPEFKSVLKYISEKESFGYSDPKMLGEDKYIDQKNVLGVGEEVNYKVKVWLDESADSTYMDKEFKAKIVVEARQAKTLSSVVKSTIGSRNDLYVEEDGIIYISGKQDDNNPETTDDIDFNYIWYSGKLWRIIAIYPDGTMKLVTDGLLTSIAFGENNKFYTDENTSSYVYQWLNQEFLPTLYNYENIIVEDAIWNASPGNGEVSTKLPVEGQEEVLVSTSVGLLNSYEYYKSYEKATDNTGYLNQNYETWLLNPYNGTSSVDTWLINTSGMASHHNLDYAFSVRPSVNLKSNIEFVGGSGTASDPYKIKGDREDAVSGTLLNTRSSGEYVNFNGEKYRIVSIENGNVKILKDDYIRDSSDVILTKLFASDEIFAPSTNTKDAKYWDYYLNNTWKSSIDDNYESMLVEGTYYTKYFAEKENYKGVACSSISNTISFNECDKTGSSTWTGYVGLPMHGEMFANQNEYTTSERGIGLWLITPNTDNYDWYIDGANAGFKSHKDSYRGVRPTLHLKSDVVITSGSGTKNDPYEIDIANVKNFKYDAENKYYTYNVENTGEYKIELWGAQGGGNSGGKGAYTSGVISLSQGETLYIYVGGRGPQNATTTNVGGYNGGGYSGNNSADNSYGGGGATDVRLVDGTWNDQTSLASRIMVAAGGAGNTAELSSTSPAGGALTGGNATSSHSTYNKATYLAKGATQTAGGTAYQGTTRNGSFGYASQTNTTGWGGGGGGGYYGGGTGYGGTGSSGSSFISGYTGCVAIASSSSITARTGTNGATCANGTTDNLCSVHYSGKVFTDTVMIAGSSSMPSSATGNETGHPGDGYARITYLGE